MKWFNHYCPICCRNRRQVILFSYINEKVDPEIPTEYTLTECNGCGEPGLFLREDEGFGFHRDGYVHLWRGDRRKWGGIVPYSVRKFYGKCVDLEKKGQWNSLVLEVGKTLEAICKDLAPEKKGLGNALLFLRTKGVVTGDLYDWANELRLLRNLTAHPTGVEFDDDEATGSFDLLEAIIRTVYWTRWKFKNFRKRQKDETY